MKVTSLNLNNLWEQIKQTTKPFLDKIQVGEAKYITIMHIVRFICLHVLYMHVDDALVNGNIPVKI